MPRQLFRELPGGGAHGARRLLRSGAAPRRPRAAAAQLRRLPKRAFMRFVCLRLLPVSTIST
jgi:hypothetical protein